MSNDIYAKGEMFLFGSVGEWLGEEHFTPTDVRFALARHGKGDLIVHLNSGGGFAIDGVAIYHLLRDHPGRVRVMVEGMAASAASVVAMAGSEIVMRRGSTMMIHDPAAMVFGTSQGMETARQGLEAQAAEVAEIYALRSRKSVAEVRRMMIAETWFTGVEAVEAGFADRVDAAESQAVARFDYAKAYMRVPQSVMAAITKAASRAPLREAMARSNAAAMAERPAPTAASGRKLAGLMDDYNRRNRPR